MTHACVGENVTMKMSGISEDALSKGYVLCPEISPCRTVLKFKAQIQIIELLEERPVMTVGYKAILHIHTAIEECEIKKMEEVLHMTTKKKEKDPKFVRESDVLWCIIKVHR